MHFPLSNWALWAIPYQPPSILRSSSSSWPPQRCLESPCCCAPPSSLSTKTMSNSSSAGTSSKLRAASSQPSDTTTTTTSSKRKRGVFQKELQHMMYGFGDDPNPLPESVALMEDIIVEYVTELVHKAQDIGSQRGKLSEKDFLYLIRKDMPKSNRCSELLSMNEELKQARKVFEADEEKLRKDYEVEEPVE